VIHESNRITATKKVNKSAKRSFRFIARRLYLM
jgi:hypothetical protein